MKSLTDELYYICIVIKDSVKGSESFNLLGKCICIESFMLDAIKRRIEI